MNKTIIAGLGALLLAGPAIAAPQPIQDRIAALCSVSNTDLEGQRMARTCKAQVRAQYEAEQLAARTPGRSVRTASNDSPRPR